MHEPTDQPSRIASRLREKLGDARTVTVRGSITAAVGPTVRARVPEVKIGEVVRVLRPPSEPLLAEVIGFRDDETILMPLGELDGLPLRAEVEPTRKPMRVPVGVGLAGRVVDALGRPIDGMPLPNDIERRSIDAVAPPSMTRSRVRQRLHTGISAVDGLMPLGVGQRIGLFAAAGVGKSTLLGEIAKHVEADAIVVALIGERGREVREFVEDNLGPEGLARASVVVATSDEPALMRVKAALTATAIAEAHRDAGRHVVLMMDSVTRFARALREVGLAAGEPPTRQGYPPSVFATLPRLFERAGHAATGVITGIYTVLVAGDDVEEPVADETMSLLDGHIMLSRALAARQQRPAIDVVDSVSRVMGQLELTDEHRTIGRSALAAVSFYESVRPQVQADAFRPSTDEEEHALEAGPRIWEALRQPLDAPATLEQTLERLQDALG